LSPVGLRARAATRWALPSILVIYDLDSLDLLTVRLVFQLWPLRRCHNRRVSKSVIKLFTYVKLFVLGDVHERKCP